jgi:hypothetical protein
MPEQHVLFNMTRSIEDARAGAVLTSRDVDDINLMG